MRLFLSSFTETIGYVYIYIYILYIAALEKTVMSSSSSVLIQWCRQINNIVEN